MKKTILIVAGCLLVLVAAGLVWLSRIGINFSEGICIAADNESYLVVLDRSPIVMCARWGDGDIFDDLETGDRIFIIHDRIAESYPGRTGVYVCIKLGESYEEDIPTDMIEQLKELGWIATE